MITNFISAATGTYNVDNSYEIWMLEEGVQRFSSTDALFESANWHDNNYVINGNLIGGVGADNCAFRGMGDGASLTVGAAGLLSSDVGARSTGLDFSLTNNGTIFGNKYGILSTGDNVSIVNNGSISGNNNPNFNCAGVSINNQTAATFINNGTVEGGITADSADLRLSLNGGSIVSGAVYVANDMGDKSRTVNHGEISAGNSSSAYYAGQGDDTLINRGTINGAVNMGDGNDRYDGRGGGLPLYVNGGAGNDTFVVDTRTLDIDENAGGGYDRVLSTVSFSFSSQNYQPEELEVLMLLGKKNINGTGNALNNEIHGNKGNNKIRGMDGDDNLSGGRGRDVLTGGAGSDTFQFTTGLGKEIITDFEDGVDHILLSAGMDIVSVHDLLKHHVRQMGDDLVISGDGTQMILKHVDKADLGPSDFIM